MGLFSFTKTFADASCRSIFGSESFLGLVHDAYTRVGAKFHYFGER